MGVSQKTLRRLLEFRQAGLIGPGSRMVELGSQNVQCEAGGAHVEAFIAEFAGRPVAADPAELDWIASGGTMARLMKFCGVKYLAIDIFEAEDTLLFDLNTDAVPRRLQCKFDIVTNFGTSEHVLDQRRAFETVHDFTKPGGIIYHDVPMGGYFYHGYFAYTPLFFNHLAAANNYEIIFRHFSKAPLGDPLTRGWTDELRDNGWPDPGYHDVGIEFVFRKTTDERFRLPVEVGTSVAVDRKFLESKRADIKILGAL